VPIAGTESSWKPFFSPDGAWVGFFDDTNNLLKRVRIDGTGAQTLADAPATGRSAVWRNDGTIVFMSRGLGGLSSVPEAGGQIEPLTRQTDPVNGQVGDPGGPYWFDLLPGGSVAVGQQRVDVEEHIVAVDLATEEVKVLFPGLSPRFVRDHLVYGVDDEALWAVRFDPEALEVTGAPIRIADGVDVRPNDRALYAVTDDVLVYAPAASGGSVPVWIDRQGNREPLGLEAAGYSSPKISPDGRRVALGVNEQGNRDILVYDLDSGVSTRVSFEPSWDSNPVWTPDGRRIVFRSERDHPGRTGNLYVRRADGVGDVVRLTQSPANQIPYGFTTDGSLLYAQDGDIWMIAIDPGSTPVRITQSAAVEIQPALAPNGRFLALQSNEQGPREIFVRTFPDFDGTWMVSTLDISLVSGTVNADVRDAWTPVWSPTGRELYYQSGRTIVAVPVRIDGAFGSTTPQVLFESVNPNDATGPQFDVSRDGERLLVLEVVPGDRNELIVVQDWADVLGEAGRE
jgi:serine/threonine-protein kinase